MPLESARPPLGDLADGLNEIETCCERLGDWVEDALIGTRKEGLSASRAIVSVEAPGAFRGAKMAQALLNATDQRSRDGR